jgi:hypothetical protein
LKYVEFIKDEQFKIQRFVSGLPSMFSGNIQYDDPKTLDEAIRRVEFLYDQHRGRQNFHEAWEDKKRGKTELRKKGNKPPLFRNNSQGKPNHNESQMLETLGKRPRKKPMKCLSCEGYHMYIEFPHRGEKLRTLHNIHHAEIVEDMAINMSRIYAYLDNKQVEFQCHMIEVEVKINDQTIAILID